MKTPDEIKKGLEVCATLDGDCENCPYDDGKQLSCVDRSRKDALTYIQQLESRLAQVERERDAAVSCLHGNCEVCRFEDTIECSLCIHSDEAWAIYSDKWEWRGVCPENSKEETK